MSPSAQDLQTSHGSTSTRLAADYDQVLIETWRTNGRFALICGLFAFAIFSVADLVVDSGLVSLPLAQRHTYRAGASIVLFAIVWRTRSCPLSQVRPLLVVGLTLFAATHGGLAALMDSTLGTPVEVSSGFATICVTAFFPARTVVALSVAFLTGMAFCLSYSLHLAMEEASLQAIPGVLIGSAPIVGTMGSVLFERAQARQYEVSHQLEQALALAREGSEAKSLFLTNVSHELRTPLNGVMGMTSLLSKQLTDPQQQKLAKTIQGSAENLLLIIEDLLDFSKIESGRITIQEEPFSIREVASGCTDLLTPQARESGIDLAHLVSDSVDPVCIGDEGRVRQILLNLVGNAIKFTERGYVHVMVERRSDGQVCFEVQDTGIGIEADKLELIFDGFTQVDGTTSRRFGGTGLGLAISRDLARLMGGDITVTSRPGVGSCFRLLLPLPVAPDELRGPMRDGEADFNTVDLSLHPEDVG